MSYTVADMRAQLGFGSEIDDAAVVDAWVAGLGFSIAATPAPAPRNPFATALRALFRAPGSAEAVFAPVTGDPVPTRTIRSQASAIARRGGGSAVVDSNAFELMREDVPVPAHGDHLVVGGVEFTLFGDPLLDAEGLSWSCPAVPSA